MSIVEFLISFFAVPRLLQQPNSSEFGGPVICHLLKLNVSSIGNRLKVLIAALSEIGVRRSDGIRWSNQAVQKESA